VEGLVNNLVDMFDESYQDVSLSFGNTESDTRGVKPARPCQMLLSGAPALTGRERERERVAAIRDLCKQYERYVVRVSTENELE
jgi:hypothetical protein